MLIGVSFLYISVTVISTSCNAASSVQRYSLKPIDTNQFLIISKIMKCGIFSNTSICSLQKKLYIRDPFV